VRDKDVVYRELQACLRELDAAQEREHSVCPPVEALELHGQTPVLSDECLKAQEERRRKANHVELLTEEYRKL